MSESEPENEVFEVARVKSLIELMRENDLSEIDLKHGERRIRLRRGDQNPPHVIMGAPMQGYPQMQNYAPLASPMPTVGAPAVVGPAAEVEDANTKIIKSPMVGTFYSKPSPEAKMYVQVGDTVSADTVVCQIEAMKMFSEIPAGISGTITAVLVQNEEAVDVNKPLFKVR